MPKSYWGEAVLTTTHLINGLPYRVLGFKTPMDILSSFYSNMRTTNHLIPKIFGVCVLCTCSQSKQGKIGPNSG